MTAPGRWTPDTEHLVAQVLRGHVDYTEPAAPDVRVACSCGDTIWQGPLSEYLTAAGEFGRHRAAAILTALAGADVLLPVGGETRVEWGICEPDGRVDIRSVGPHRQHAEAFRRIQVEHQPGAAASVLVSRTVTTSTGAWREVTDDPA